VLQFATAKDDVVASTFAVIQQAQPPETSSHSIPSLAKHASCSYLGALFRVAGPLHQRLIAIGGTTNRSVAAQLANPPEVTNTAPCASFVNAAHNAALTLRQSFTYGEHHSANLIAPRGSIITSAGDPSSSVSHDLCPTLQLDVTPPLSQAVVAPKGVRFVASGLRKLTEWRSFFTLHGSSSSENKPKLLTHSGHGNVSILHSDIPPGRADSALTARMPIRRIIGAPSLGRERLASFTRCPQCGLSASAVESLERNVVRCPNGGMRHMMHYGLVQVLKSIIKDVGKRDIAVVTEARGLRPSNASRPGDVVVLDPFRDGQHLVNDAVVTTNYRNTLLRQVSTILGYAAKKAEDMKLNADKSSAEPVAIVHGGPHARPSALRARGWWPPRCTRSSPPSLLCDPRHRERTPPAPCL
jgi:hypothetical protein